jgi:hypothetical protein
MASDPHITEPAREHSTGSSRLIARLAAGALTIGIAFAPGPASADQGGVSFWLPGTFGSLAAVPGTPGWTFGTIYYHTSVDASASRSFNIGGGIAAGLDARVDLVMLNATYVFATPVFGAQASFGLTGLYARNTTSINATLVGPGGGVISGSRSQSLWGFGDLYPQFALKWNHGVHNFMAYTMWGLPVGAYDADRLANIGIGHWSADFGGGYTYFNPQTGHEFSAVAGFTYNFINPSTQYQNGINFHLDWAASQFLSKQFFVGAVGYVYQQITGDSGAGATLGPFKSRVFSVGPQLGYLFPVGGMQGVLNLKGYYEFGAQNRPEGWNAWLVFAVSPAAQPAPQPPLRSRF